MKKNFACILTVIMICTISFSYGETVESPLVQAVRSMMEDATLENLKSLESDLQTSIGLVQAEIERREAEGITDGDVKPDAQKSAYADFGDYAVEATGLQFGTRGEKTYLILNCTWWNQSSDTNMFSMCFTSEMYQDGVALEREYFTGLDTNTATSIMPGASLDVSIPFELRNDSPVTIIIDSIWNFNGEYAPMQWTADIADALKMVNQW